MESGGKDGSQNLGSSPKEGWGKKRDYCFGLKGRGDYMSGMEVGVYLYEKGEGTEESNGYE